MSKKNKLRIIPLGGLGEVGKNMMAYEFGGDIIVVDAGIMFPHNDMLGVDYIIPDFEYIIKRANRVLGLIITHGHEDHIGAIQHVIDQINVTATNGNPFTQAETLCDAMKDQNIIIYTVGFDVGNDDTIIDFMTGCATDEDHAYLAATASELQQAFQEIATSITLLRLSK